MKNDITTKMLLLAIVLLLAVVAIRPYLEPAHVSADSARFDHVFIASSQFLYKGEQGLLVMDKRNANVWFLGRTNNGFKDPVFLIRLPFEKLDEAPR